MVILCFERRFFKQNSVVRFKLKILPPPKFLGWLRHCANFRLSVSFDVFDRFFCKLETRACETLRSCARRLRGLAVKTLPGASRSFNPALAAVDLQLLQTKHAVIQLAMSSSRTVSVILTLMAVLPT